MATVLYHRDGIVIEREDAEYVVSVGDQVVGYRRTFAQAKDLAIETATRLARLAAAWDAYAAAERLRAAALDALDMHGGRL